MAVVHGMTQRNLAGVAHVGIDEWTYPASVDKFHIGGRMNTFLIVPVKLILQPLPREMDSHLEEVAAYLKVGKRTVYRLAAARKIPAFKVGGIWRFSRTEIDRWIKQQSTASQG